jgi:hypothetical protein
VSGVQYSANDATFRNRLWNQALPPDRMRAREWSCTPHPSPNHNAFRRSALADLTPIDVATFWSRVAGSTQFQCWLWTGRANDHGYGRFKDTMAHRVAYELVKGPIPAGLVVRHRCDNPPCCNPAHLEVGTPADNSKDAVQRGRLARGPRHGNTKLTESEVLQIRANPDRQTVTALAERYAVSKSTISYIRSGRSWKVVGAEGIEPSTSAVSRQRSSAELCARDNGPIEPMSPRRIAANSRG